MNFTKRTIVDRGTTMTKLVANKRDQAARAHNFTLRYGFRVGSFFKGCKHCGETEVVNGHKVWRSGYDVFRIYQPTRVGYMYWCYSCGAKDERCWSLSDTNVAYARWLSMHSVRAGVN